MLGDNMTSERLQILIEIYEAFKSVHIIYLDDGIHIGITDYNVYLQMKDRIDKLSQAEKKDLMEFGYMTYDEYIQAKHQIAYYNQF